jgi:pyruvate dehydrogenase E2 component (dihydrolipoamide acetyltransferase)
MKSQIITPSIADNTKACALTRWHMNDSCLVARGDLIATLETKKAILDIEAEHDGCLHHSAHEGMTVAYGEPIGYIEHDGLVSKGESLILMLELSTADLSLIDSSRGNAPRDAFVLDCIREALARKRS